MTLLQSPFRDDMAAALERVTRLQEENARLSAELHQPKLPQRRRLVRSRDRMFIVLASFGILCGAGVAAVDGTPNARAASGAPVDRAAIVSAFAAVDSQACAAPGVTYVEGLNDLHLTVTFATDGRVSQARVDTKRGESAVFDGTPVARCVVAKVRAIRIPPFAGTPVSVGKIVRIH
jgi:hypothetical protein